MSSGISTTKDQAGHGNPFLSFSVVFNNYFVPDEIVDRMKTSEKEQQTYSIKEGDIFLTRTSEVVDELAMSCVALKDYKGATFSGFLKRLRPKKDNLVYPKYMAFYLRSPIFRRVMTNNAVMTLRASLNEAIFSYIPVYLPEYKEQVKIGDFLYLIEKKISNNNHINLELEKIARLLFDYWFIQFDFPDSSGNPYKTFGGKMVYNSTLKREIPEGWEDCKLEKIIKIHDSKRVPLSAKQRDLIKGNIPYYGATSIMGYVNDYIFDGEYVLLAEDGSVMDQNGFPVLQYIFGKTWVNNHAHVLEASSGFSNPLLHLFLKKIPVIKMMSGSIQKKINQDNLRNTPILLPPIYLLEAINPILKSIYEKKIQIQKENFCLDQLRDWLLPMLMNGQISIQDAEEHITKNFELKE